MTKALEFEKRLKALLKEFDAEIFMGTTHNNYRADEEIIVEFGMDNEDLVIGRRIWGDE